MRRTGFRGKKNRRGGEELPTGAEAAKRSASAPNSLPSGAVENVLIHKCIRRMYADRSGGRQHNPSRLGAVEKAFPSRLSNPPVPPCQGGHCQLMKKEEPLPPGGGVAEAERFFTRRLMRWGVFFYNKSSPHRRDFGLRPRLTDSPSRGGSEKSRGGRGGVARRESRECSCAIHCSRFRTPFPIPGFRRGGVAPAVGDPGFSPHERRPRVVSAGRFRFRSPSRGAC